MKTVMEILIDLSESMKNKLFLTKRIFLEDVIPMKRSLFYIFIIMSLCNGFGQQVIPLRDNLRMESCNASNYISSIRYIPLETTDKCLLNEEGISIIATAQFFFIHDFKQDVVYRFEAKSGKFLNTIGRKGQGPGEYKRLFGIYVDDTDKKCFLLDTYASSIFEYSYDGKFQKRISGLQAPSDMERIGNNYVVNNDRYMETKQELFLINRNGKLLRHSTLLDKSRFGFTVSQPFFFKCNDVCYYKNYLSDNIYSVDESLKKQAVWIIDCGTKEINPKDNQYDLQKGALTKDKINISSIRGYRNLLFIIYGYSEKLCLSIYNTETGKIITPGSKGVPGFTDDLTGGPAVMLPYKNSNHTNSVVTGQFISVLHCSNWEELSRYKSGVFGQVISKLDEDSNPIVRIITLKQP